WQVTNPNVRDFRRAAFPNLTWTATTLSPTSPGVYIGDVAMPASGARAYFVEMTYATSSPNPLITTPFVFTTDMLLRSTLPFYPWPFESAFEPLAAPAACVAQAPADGTLNAAASALVLESQSVDLVDAKAADIAAPLAAQPAEIVDIDSPLLFDE